MDEFNEFEEDFSQDTTTTQNNNEDYASQGAVEYDDSDLISELLRSKGIQDPSRIKFENAAGQIEELDWNSLDPREQINILNQGTSEEEALDTDEILLLNAIRNSGLTPREYMEYVQKDTINRYNAANNQPNFVIDNYTDDELFMADFKSRSDNITDEEAVEALEKIKSNPTLYQKQVDAIRQNYKQLEYRQMQEQQMEQNAQMQQQYQEYANKVVDSINGFTDFSGYSLNMNDEDKQEIYDFITGYDAAGNNYFQKALNDPDLLVKMAWFALKGEQMVRDIDAYYRKELASSRYNNRQDVIYKPKSRARSSSTAYIDDDLD